MNTYDVRTEFQGGYTARRATTELIIVHHAAALYPTPSGIGDVRAVANYHTLNRGWPGIGYHVALAEEQQGDAIAEYVLSAPDLERAHIYGRNDIAVGVSCLTNFTGLPDPKWVEALVPVLVRARRRYPNAEIAGHGERALPGWGTTCPGPRWQDWKPRLLAMVDAALRQSAKLQRYKVRRALHAAVPVYEAPSAAAPVAWGGDCWLPPGYAVEIDQVVDGWAHWPAAGFIQVGHLERPDVDAGVITPDTPLLLGPDERPRATLDQCAAYMLSRPHGGYSDRSIALEILPAYFGTCAAVGLDPLLVIAQMIHETGNLTSPRSQRPQRNPAGIGATDDSTPGLFFASWAAHAIPAHTGRLLAYALTDDQATPTQRRLITVALRERGLPAAARGSAPTLRNLSIANNPTGYGWAKDPRYPELVAEIANAIRSR